MPRNTHPSPNGILNSRGFPTPLALVLEWNRHSVQIMCTYCLLRHRHGVGNPPWCGQTRETYCYRAAGNFSSHEYQLCYPYEGAAMDYSYEIDTKGCRFRTVGVTTAEEDEEDEIKSTPCIVGQIIQVYYN
ncbi:hypothetical protein BKA60DRAFT_162048 [Fusarium oxysporum]|nr:hypothetical protein BKA60DRAFT_162048 [Fusarium oxysporum]